MLTYEILSRNNKKHLVQILRVKEQLCKLQS